MENVSTTPAGIMQPVTQGERIQVIDMLRGFALLGILLVNAELFGWPFQEMMQGLSTEASTLEYVINWFVAFAAQGKFYPLFSFLFGLGFTVIMVRAEARGIVGAKLFARRLFVLLAIGLVHGLLIWAGDILTIYAVLSFLLLAMHNLKPRTLLILAVILLAIPLMMGGLMTAMMSLSAITPEGAVMMAGKAAAQQEEMSEMYTTAMQAYASSSWLDVMAQRWRDYSQMLTFLPFWGPSVLGMFLLGVYFGKRGFLHDIQAHLPLFRKLTVVGLVIGVPCAAYFATAGMYLNMGWPTWESFLVNLANIIAGPLFCLMYVSLFVLFLRNVRALAPLASMGRMALTNYLLQSIVWTLVFYGYGLDFFGTVGMPALVLGAVVFWLLQIPFSHWWLQRFRFGPAEWLWRSLTYGKRQPMRKQPVAQEANSAA